MIDDLKFHCLLIPQRVKQYCTGFHTQTRGQIYTGHTFDLFYSNAHTWNLQDQKCALEGDSALGNFAKPFQQICFSWLITALHYTPKVIPHSQLPLSSDTNHSGQSLFEAGFPVTHHIYSSTVISRRQWTAISQLTNVAKCVRQLVVQPIALFCQHLVTSLMPSTIHQFEV